MIMINMQGLNERGLTHSLGDLNMLGQHRHLLFGDKTLEVLPGLSRVDGLDARDRTIPKDPAGKREEVFHHVCLAGELHVDRAVTQPGRLAAGRRARVFLHGAHSIVHSQELDVNVMSLAGDALHDNVDRLLVIIQDLRVPTQEGDDLGSLGGEWDLECL